MPAPVKTICPYCGVGCGVVARRAPDGGVLIQGDPEHPSNYGRLCSKGAALGETLDLGGRLLYPHIRGERRRWDEALDYVASGFTRIIREHGPDAVAFYISGQLLTEDYYVANKLMKGFIGSANVDTNSRLCMSSSVAGHKRAFGADTVPGCYEDLELAQLIVLAGSNAAWCHPVLFQRIAEAKRQNPKLTVVVIDPRRTATCDVADLHLALAPGTDVVLWNGLLNFLRQHGAIDFDFLEAHAEGYAAALRAAQESAPSVPAVARACGLEEEDVARFFNWFARTEKVVSAYSQGVNQSSSGSDKVNAIINCHLATGRIGRPGMGPLSLTGQPNAMGGREVGGLANQLAAHMDFEAPESIERVRRFWNATAMARVPGLKALDMFRAVGEGRIKALWIMATNPVVSLPDADAVRRALQRCELLVVSDCMRATDTADLAHVLLPAFTWGEKDGTVTNSERRISRQRAFLPPAGEAQPDWWIVTQVARRMGYAAAFPYQSPADIFREHAALSGFENGGARDFDISGLSHTTDEQYRDLAPLQWPVRPGAAAQDGARLFGDGRFYTPSGRARFVAVEFRPPAYRTDPDYPLVLNTGRVRDQWHTMTHTGQSPRLAAHICEPYAELHPEDAARLGVRDGALVRIISRWGAMLARARCALDQRRGSVFVPIHWNDHYASRARVGALVNPAADPLSGQPESKHTPVRVEPYTPAWHGFVLARRPLDFPRAGYWVSVAGRAFWRYELAGETAPQDWPRWARALLCPQGATQEWLEYWDKSAGRYRAAHVVGGRLDGCVFIAPGVELPPRAWLAELFSRDELSPPERMSLLAGRPAKAQDAGRVVCACFGVGMNTLLAAIRDEGLVTPEAVGAALKAGTNCGSCVPEIKALIAEAAGARVA